VAGLVAAQEEGILDALDQLRLLLAQPADGADGRGFLLLHLYFNNHAKNASDINSRPSSTGIPSGLTLQSPCDTCSPSCWAYLWVFRGIAAGASFVRSW
jgi:hypothetical protein